MDWTTKRNFIDTYNASDINALQTYKVDKDADGNVGVGTAIFGTAATNTLAVATGSEPLAHVDDEIQVFSVDSSDGAATLGLVLEQNVEDIGTFTASHKIKVKINGTEYWLQLDAV